MTRAMRSTGLALVALAGCTPIVQTPSELAQVPTSPFAPSAVQTVNRASFNFNPTAHDVAMRVDAVGRTLLAANPQLAIKPAFTAVGVPEAEIFHADQTGVYVTEGLVKQCPGDAELAAVLAIELGRMVSEREAAIGRDTRVAEARLPIALPIGGQGNPYTADPSYYFEMAKFEKEHPRAERSKVVPPPDPRVVAGTILDQAGYHRADLETVAPILLNAARNTNLESQFRGVSGSTWRPQ